jgi:hypothetical protein
MMSNLYFNMKLTLQILQKIPFHFYEGVSLKQK